MQSSWIFKYWLNVPSCTAWTNVIKFPARETFLFYSIIWYRKSLEVLTEDIWNRQRCVANTGKNHSYKNLYWSYSNKLNLFGNLVQNWKSSNIAGSPPAAKSVSWHGLLEWYVRGKWRVSRQCLWVDDCTTDHADSWVQTTSYRWSREQGCWHVLSQPDLFHSQEDVRSHRICHAAHVCLQQKPLSLPTVKRFYLQFGSRQQLNPHPAQHPHQQPLKQNTTSVSKSSSIRCPTKTSVSTFRPGCTKHQLP